MKPDFPVIAISLPRSSERRTSITAQLRAEWGDAWEILTAVDGEALDITQLYRAGYIREARWMGRPLARGEVGCWLSHLLALDMAVVRSVTQMVVLEDDAVLVGGIRSELETRLTALEAAGIEWDVCMLGCYEGAGTWAPRNPGWLWPGGFFPLDAETKGSPGTYGYMVTQRGGRRLLGRMCQSPIDMPVDEVFQELCDSGLRVVCASPPLVVSSGHPSTIHREDCSAIAARAKEERLFEYRCCLRRYAPTPWWHHLKTSHRDQEGYPSCGGKAFDLGGNGHRGRVSVDLCGDSDIRCDILDVDGYAGPDSSVDEFYLFHTLEHVPVDRYYRFLCDLKRKLRPGGRITVIQSDAGESIRQWASGKLNFRSMRAVIFPPADRVAEEVRGSHHQMWTADEVCRDFSSLGMKAEPFDGGSWRYDLHDELCPEDTRACQGVEIKNLGVTATKLYIPRLVHQTWKTEDIPEHLYSLEWVETWQEMDGFEYRFWTDRDNRQLISTYYPWFLEVYDAYDSGIKRAIAARYFILHRYGGIYVDLDFVRLKPLDALLLGRDLLLGYERPNTLGNAIMGCAPAHPEVERLIHALERHSNEHVLQATGPGFLTRYLGGYILRDQFLSSDLVYPYPWDDPRKEEFRRLSMEQLRSRFPSAFAVTHWSGSWL